MNNKLIPIVLTLVVGIILAGSVLMPVLNDAKKTIGDEVTYTNSMTSSNQYRYDYVDSLELTATASETDGVSYDFVINGKEITLIGDYMLAVASDGIVIQIGTAGQFAYSTYMETYASEPNLSPTTYPEVTLTMSEGAWSLKAGDTTLKDGTYTWIVTYKDDGRYVAHNSSVVGAYCHETPSDFIVYGGGYTSGDLDTFYSYGQGKLTVAVSDYEGTLNWNTTLVDGTTDVYKVTTCNITISDGENDETYTPYRCLYLYEVTGHEAGGASYSLLGAIPVMVIVALIMGAVGMIVVKRND